MTRSDFRAEAGLRALARSAARDPLNAVRHAPALARALREAVTRRRRGLLSGYLSIGLPDEAALVAEASSQEVRRALKTLKSGPRHARLPGLPISRLDRRVADIVQRASTPVDRPKECRRRAGGEARTRQRALVYAVHDSIPNRQNGYAVRTHALLAAMASRGWRVVAVARPTSEPAQDVTLNGVRYVRSHLDSEDWRDWDAYLDRFSQDLVSVAEEIGALAVQAASNHITGAAAARAAAALSRPFVYEVRGLWHVTRQSGLSGYERTVGWAAQERAEADVARRANRVLTLNGAMADRLVEMGVERERVELLPNAGVECAEVADKRPGAAHLRLGYIGSLVRYEGLDSLLEAMSSLPNDSRSRLSLHIYGDGESRAALEALTGQSGLGRQVTFHGRFDPLTTKPASLYSGLDLVVLPRRETAVTRLVSPLKPYEAAAHGCALLVSNVAPLAEFAANSGAALTFAAGDRAALMASLQRVLGSPEMLDGLGQAGRDYVASQANWDRRAGDLERMLISLAQAR
ncbi:MAG: glycosyltransferase family 4 protein [Litorimonas sp.]